MDYDERQYRVYAKGRALSPEVLSQWTNLFARYAPPHRPLSVLDLGSGVGRFAPSLAREFGGPVYGVEPSVRMREIAQATAAHPRVSYVDGRAERIPLPGACCDFGLIFLVWHHVTDRPAAVRELARVLRPGASLAIRTTFVDRTPELLWYGYFPSAAGIEARIFPTLAEIERDFAAGGFAVTGLITQHMTVAESLADYAVRLGLRAISTFEYLDEEEIAAGLERMRRDAAAETVPRPITLPCDVLFLTRAGGREV